ncbi:MAG: metallophosphoesterase family protein [Candidatus Omnitrophota bacterium]
MRVFLCSVIVFLAGSSFAAQEKTDSFDFVVKPYLQYSTQNQMTILWETTAPAKSQVQYYEAVIHSVSPEWMETPGQGTESEMNEIALTGLKPETNYFYRTISTTEDGQKLESELYSFKTAVKEDSAYAFAVFSDSQTNPEVWGKIAELAWRERPNFAVHAGDIVGTGGNKSQWVDHFLKPGHVFMSRIPIFAILGNHENDDANYYRYISNPKPEYYYSFQYGNAQFFLLDSCRDAAPGGEIYRWLDSALASSKSRWKFVVHHHPPYSSDENDYGDAYKEKSLLADRHVQSLISLYEKHNVDMVFFGHIHDYERTWPLRQNRINHQNGVIYIQTGGCGGDLENYAPTRSWFTQKVHRDHHFCLINIHDNHLEFQAIDRNWNLFDAFSLVK